MIGTDILLSIPLTLVAYGIIPLILASTRKKPITKKAFRIISYSLNAVVMILLNAFGIIQTTTIVPYLLWTWLFTRLGLSLLDGRWVLKDDQEQPEETQQIAKPTNEPDPSTLWQCTCGRTHPKYETSCICGKSRFDNVQQNKAVSPKETTNASNTDKILFCRKCGEKLIDGNPFCPMCGTEIAVVSDVNNTPPVANKKADTIWICEKCKAKNLSARNTCWSCGKPQ